MNTQEKLQHLNAMHYSWSSCQACQLCEKRRNVVFGYGNPDAKIMIIGEAPGAHEDEEGVPFVGNAGVLLDQYLAQVSPSPELMEMCAANRFDSRRIRQILLQDYFFTNVVACRPPENRDPIPKEIEACRSRLLDIIYLVDPLIIITVGGIATQALVGKKVAITSVRGELFEVQLPGRATGYPVSVIPILHTSFLLRQNDFKQAGGYGEKTYFDILRAHVLLDELNWREFNIPKPKGRPALPRR